MPEDQHINPKDSAIAEVRRRANASQQDITPFSPNLMLIRQRVKVIIDRLRKEIDFKPLYNLTEETQYQIRSQIREMVNQDQAPLSIVEKSILLQSVLDEIFGFGPLGPLLRDPTIGDICVNGPQSICVKSKRGWEKSTAIFEGKKHLLVTIEKILLPLGLRVDNSCPSVSAYLPNGSAVYVAIPPVSAYGPVLSIRCFPQTSLEQMFKWSPLSSPITSLLKAYVRAKANIVISGPLRSATTLVNALSAYVDPRERVITIGEPTALRLQHKQWIKLEPCLSNEEGKNEVTMRMLVSKAVDLCADRIIIGDCRGAEVYELLSAVNAGTAGSLAIVTANSVNTCLRRLESMVRLGDPILPVQYAREIIADGVNVIIQLKQTPNGSIPIFEITEIRRLSGDKFKLATMFKLECIKTAEGNTPVWQYVSVERRSQFVDYTKIDFDSNDTEVSSKLNSTDLQSSTDIAEELRAQLEYFKQS
jgi:pilus assembly protein CpaF